MVKTKDTEGYLIPKKFYWRLVRFSVQSLQFYNRKLSEMKKKQAKFSPQGNLNNWRHEILPSYDWK